MEVQCMEKIQLGANICIIVSAVFAAITLLVTLLKEIHYVKPNPFWRKLAYRAKFADILANTGSGLMKIIDIKYFYDGQEENVDTLERLYANKLGVSPHDLKWTTFLDKTALKNRSMISDKELVLLEINTDDQKNQQAYPNLFQALRTIRRYIDIEITYKNIYGIKRTTRLKLD